MQNQSQWFVIRTKPRKENLAFNELRVHAGEAFLPQFRTSVPVFGRLAWVRAPLFPCYLFARFTVDAIFKVRNTRGVREIVSSGDEPSALPEGILNDLKARCVDGVVELQPQRFEPNEPVRVKLGIFRGWDAIFERYLSADDRVAVMLRAVETTGVRVVLPAGSIGKA